MHTQWHDNTIVVYLAVSGLVRKYALLSFVCEGPPKRDAAGPVVPVLAWAWSAASLCWTRRDVAERAGSNRRGEWRELFTAVVIQMPQRDSRVSSCPVSA